MITPSIARAAAIAATSIVLSAHSAADAGPLALTTVHQFTGYILGNPDGYFPIAPLAIGAGGVLYGATDLGGVANATCPQGCGMVFSLTPPAQLGGPWIESALHSFTAGSDGYWPRSGLTLGPGSTIYGTTVGGGAFGNGTIFSLALSGNSWAETTVYTFAGPITGGADGAGPEGGLVLSRGGVLFGTTTSGGVYGSGTAFSLTPPSAAGDPWVEQILWSFGGPGDGTAALAGLRAGGDGSLYGTTAGGGAAGYGAVFSLSPPSSPGGPWTEALLYSFSGGADGANPQSGTLAIDAAGVLYGTTYGGGSHNLGSVFSLTPPASPGGAWTESVLFSFAYHSGESPRGGVVVDNAGNLYGTTSFGGNAVPYAYGSIFRLARPSSPGGQWKFTELYSFPSAIGVGPWAAPTIGPGRVLYGTTSGYWDGTHNGGTVFSLTL